MNHSTRFGTNFWLSHNFICKIHKTYTLLALFWMRAPKKKKNLLTENYIQGLWVSGHGLTARFDVHGVFSNRSDSVILWVLLTIRCAGSRWLDGIHFTFSTQTWVTFCPYTEPWGLEHPVYPPEKAGSHQRWRLMTQTAEGVLCSKHLSLSHWGSDSSTRTHFHTEPYVLLQQNDRSSNLSVRGGWAEPSRFLFSFLKRRSRA